jgi:hypothetical protein
MLPRSPYSEVIDLPVIAPNTGMSERIEHGLWQVVEVTFTPIRRHNLDINPQRPI